MNRLKENIKKPTKKKNVQVAIRVRPLNENEKAEKGRAIAHCDRVTKMVTMSTLKEQKHFGQFDWVYGPEASQTDIYLDIVSPLIQEVLSGYNCTVFAYGQTGTGKTFTMEGKHDEDNDYSWEEDPKAGIIPRALHHIFSELNVMALDDFAIRISYVELYNEDLYDLLATGNVDDQARLRIFDDKAHNGNGVIINGLTEVAVRSRDEVYNLLRRGAERRRTASTLMNMNSSRSHSVFTVSVLFRDNCSKTEELLLKTGKLHLVDLAGSESIGRSGAVDKRAREAGNINQSLLTLGRVINALTTNASHIPYRESKLTRILQDSLGGKTITTIIATISPSSTNLEESNSTLDYAQRAKNIKNNPEVNQQITRKALLREYNDEIEKLRKDLAAAREKNGIFLAQENYEQMQEQMTENNARIEELEGQLMAITSKMQLMLNDLEFLENQYELAYRKHLDALQRLDKRRNELQKEKEEHARCQKSLLVVKAALEQSTEKSTQLFAQAVEVNESNMIIGNELEAMYNKFEQCKEIFEKNDKLFGQFSARRIHDSHQIKDKVSDFARSSASSMDALKRICHKIDESVTHRLNSLSEEVSKMCSHTLKFSEDNDEWLSNFSTYTKEHAQEYLVKFDSNLESLKNYCVEILEISKSEMAMIEKFATFANSHENKLKTLLSSYESEFNAYSDEQNDVVKEVMALMGRLHTSTSNIKQKSQTFVNSEIAEINKHTNAWKQTKEAFDQSYNKITEIAIEKQKTLESFSNDGKRFVQEQQEMSEGVKTSLTESVKELTSFVTEKAELVQESVDDSTEFYHTTASNMVSQLETLAESTQHVTSDMSVHLSTSQKDMEHFIHQEILRYSSSGDTPARKKRQFGVDLVQIPNAKELIDKFSSSQTPVHQFKIRESILNGDKIISPKTLKESLAVHKEVENEQTNLIDEA